MTLGPDEIARINRVRLAREFHKLPHEIDGAPSQDIEDLIAVITVDDKLAAEKAKQGK